MDENLENVDQSVIDELMNMNNNESVNIPGLYDEKMENVNESVIDEILLEMGNISDLPDIGGFVGEELEKQNEVMKEFELFEADVDFDQLLPTKNN